MNRNSFEAISSEANQTARRKRIGTIALILLAGLVLLLAISSAGSGRAANPLAGRPIQGALFTETVKLAASDLQAFDQFGEELDISGDTIVVASWYEAGGPGDPGPQSGSVYVYERNEGGPGNWGEVIKLRASDARLGDRFGRSVAIDSDTIVVGAAREDGGNGDPIPDGGAVYIFYRDQGGPDNWGQVKVLYASDEQVNDFFGWSVDISGDTLIVGAVNESGGSGDPIQRAGAVYIFERNEGGPDQWGEVAKVTASDAQPFDEFGFAVSISGDTLVAGAPYEDGGPGDPRDTAGAAYVFSRNEGGANSWGQVIKLTASDSQKEDTFGEDVGIDGHTIVIGASSEEGGPGDPIHEVGSVYVFERDFGGTENWGEIKKLNASDGAFADHLGRSVSISGNIIAAGAPFEDGSFPDNSGNTGAIYVFERNTGGINQWGEVQKLNVGDEDKDDNLGANVRIDGETIAAGAFREDGGPGDPLENAGAAYVFQASGLPPTPTASPTSPATNTPTVTPTSPEPTATPTATPAPPALAAYLPIVRNCTYLYYDNFGNPNSGWPNINEDDVLYQYVNGEYRLLLKNDNWWAGATPLVSFEDYLLQVEVRHTADTDGYAGLLFGRKTGWTGFYAFVISPEGIYALWRFDNGDWDLLAADITSVINQGAATNMLAVERKGNLIRLLINGKEITVLSDSTHTGVLGVGLLAISYDQSNLDVRFDDFTVEPIGCGLSEFNPSSIPASHPGDTELPIQHDQAWIEAPYEGRINPRIG